MDKVKFAAAFVISAAELAGYKVELNLVSGDNTITVKYTKKQ